MSQLMALLEATKITLDNREELVVDLSMELVEKDLQVEHMSNEIQELKELVGTRENTIEVLEDQLINTQQQLAEANQHLDMHHQEIQDMEANEDVDIEGGEEPEPASSLDTDGSGRPPSPRVERCLVCSLGCRDRVRRGWEKLLGDSLAFAPLGY
jgi:chromosome segregation ATPase